MAVSRFRGPVVDKLALSKIAPKPMTDVLSTNKVLAEAIMKEVNARYGSVDLAGNIQNAAKSFHVSFSWG